MPIVTFKNFFPVKSFHKKSYLFWAYQANINRSKERAKIYKTKKNYNIKLLGQNIEKKRAYCKVKKQIQTKERVTSSTIKNVKQKLRNI